MRFIDAHTHTFLRNFEDLERMALSGVHGLVVCAYLPTRPSASATLLDLFRWLTQEETARLETHGLQVRVALGNHPRCIPDGQFADVLEELERSFHEGAAAALGEVGLESGDARELDVLQQQLRVAKACRVPVVLHTPRQGKEKVLPQLFRVLEAESLDPSRVVIDHLTPALVPEVRAFGAMAGLTVQPGKLTPADVVAVVGERGTEGIVIDSDLSHLPSDPLALPRCAQALSRAGQPRAVVEAVTFGNAARLFGFESAVPRPVAGPEAPA